MNYQTRFCLSIGLLALCSAPLQAVQVLFTPDMDATLYEDDAGALANGTGEFLFFGRVGSSPEGGEKLRRALIKFDVSAIPADANIEAVSLSMEINKSPGVGAVDGTATLHRVTNSWAEGPTNASGHEGTGSPSATNDVTWQHRAYSSSNWSQAGGDFVATASGSSGYGAGLEPLEFSSTSGLRADVTAWVNNPASNHGWILLGREDSELTARRVYAREADGQNVPTLEVDFTTASPTDHLSLTSVVSSITRPVAIANANDGSGRLFIVQQTGLIRVFDTATQTLSATPYLDVSSLITGGSNDEQGLLGLVFHPDFENNRKFYIYYVRDPESGANRSVLAMYQQDNNNPSIANPSATVLMEFTQNFSNHNGGDMHFGADGFLYIASGDGGGSGDTYNNAQNKNTLKGKMLRIDVDGTPQVGGELCGINPLYRIPPGNAFPGTGNGCDEILHMGLRNPWKFSFDAKTEDMYIGDVGQGNWEEVDFVPANSSSLNFGWPCREGLHAYTPPAGVTCPNPVNPVVEYSSQNGSGNCSITGGYVYRGNNTALQGYYVYGDYCSSRIWMVRNQDGAWAPVEWQGAAAVLDSPTAFGQDENCELYVADIGGGDPGEGAVYRFDSSEILLSSGFETLRCQ